MTIQTFIEKAIEGGWKYHGDVPIYNESIDQWYVSDKDGGYVALIEEVIFLDPEAWKAIGRTEGWPPWESWDGPIPRDKGIPMWHAKMLYMVDALAHGGTLEAYLETL